MVRIRNWFFGFRRSPTPPPLPAAPSAAAHGNGQGVGMETSGDGGVATVRSGRAIAIDWEGDAVPEAIAPKRSRGRFDPDGHGEGLPLLEPDDNTSGQWWFWAFTVAAIALVSATFGATLTLFVPLERSPLTLVHSFAIEFRTRRAFQYRLRQPLNLLILGVDRVPHALPSDPAVFGGRNDTVLLMRLDPYEEATNLLAIPRDTAVQIPGLGLQRLAHANARGGVELVRQTLSQNFNRIHIDRYARVHGAAFRELVDLLGGIELFIPAPMAYTDATQQLEISLDAGWQTLDGAAAEQFVRFRSDGLGDVGRVRRQQMLIQALRRRMGSPDVWGKLPKIVQVVQKYVDTNLTREELLAATNFLLRQDPDRLQSILLPGRFGPIGGPQQGQWLPDRVETDRLMADLFGIDRGGNALRSHTESPAARSRYLHARTRIAVQNASGIPQGHEAIVRALRQEGFKRVYTVDPWPEVIHQSQTIVQTGNVTAGETVLTRLGAGRLVVASVGDLSSDLTVRVGTDLGRTAE